MNFMHDSMIDFSNWNKDSATEGNGMEGDRNNGG